MSTAYDYGYQPPFPQLTIHLDNPVQLYLIGIQVDSVSLVGLYVVGDDMGDEVILGRDVLNKLPLFLDGPQTQTDLLDNAVVQRLRSRRRN